MLRTSEATPVQVDRHDADGMRWEMSRRGPHPLLAGHVQGYCGYTEDTDEPLRRREMPWGGVAVILSFGDPIDVTNELSGTTRRHRSFVAGLHEGSAMTEHAGRQAGVQFDLTPLGAYRLFGLPMSEIANQVVEIDALRGREMDELADRLDSAPGWAERLDLVDDMLLRWVDDGPVPDRSITWACGQIERSRGQVPVATLADEIGWSRRHFTSRFREQVGLPPKPFGRVLRFSRAVDLLEAGSLAGCRPGDEPPSASRTIGDVAAECGYADHSHLVREFRSLGGITPSELLGSFLPGGAGISG
jgi:AraC-like DNA-binding protein